MIIEYITLGLYLALLPALGFAFSKANVNLSDYIRGGAQATWWLAGTSILMAGTSAFTFTGNASAAFTAGPTVLTIYFANIAALLLCGWFLGAWFRQTRAFTVADVIRERFGVGVEQFAAYTGLFLGPVQAAIQLWALSVFASATFELPITLCIVAIGVVVVLYSTTGGKWAVMATDFVQGVILFSITILVAILCWHKIGGFGEFFAYFSRPEFKDDFTFVKEPGQFPSDNFTPKWIIVIFFVTLYHQLSMNAADRFLVVKDGREASRASYCGAALMALGTVVWFFPPMVARFLYGDEIIAAGGSDPGSTSYSFIARKVLPNGMMGVMIAAMFAATMSSMDSGLNRQVGILARNIVPRLRAFWGRHEALSAGAEVRLCKIMTLVVGGVIIGFSLMFAYNKEIVLFEAYLIINSIIGIPLLFPMLVGMWVKPLPRWSYFAIFGGSLIPSLYSFYDKFAHGVTWTIQDRSLWIFVFGAAATLLTIPFYRYSPCAYRDQVERFFTRMRTPVDFNQEIGVSRTAWQLRLLGRSTLGIGFAFLLFLLVPNSFSSRLAVVFVAGSTLLVGLLLLWGEKVERARDAVLQGKGPNVPGSRD